VDTAAFSATIAAEMEVSFAVGKGNGPPGWVFKILQKPG
jgi:hypothetical protein